MIITFTAPWCGHCKSLKPIYENVARYFKDEKDCVVANMDADAAYNKAHAKKYGVSSYPTIKFFGTGKEDKENPITCDGGRTEQAFVDFLNEKCGSSRAVGGGLHDFAGRIPPMDRHAQKFMDATAKDRRAILGEVSGLSEDAIIGENIKRYIRVMEKVMERSNDYVTKELKRYALYCHFRTQFTDMPNAL